VLLALLGALAIGLSLGLLGSGGSILTVPVLHYLVGQPEKLAIAGSLLVVGLIAAFAAIPCALHRQVDWRNVAWFGLPGMLGAWLGATLAQWVPGTVQLVLFAVVMLLAASPISDFVDRHPTVKMLALAFLVLIGTNLVAEGMGQHISKGYTYMAMAFSVIVEMLNIRASRKSDVVKLHGGAPAVPPEHDHSRTTSVSS
jgi:hypothetical protein